MVNFLNKLILINNDLTKFTINFKLYLLLITHIFLFTINKIYNKSKRYLLNKC